MGKFTISMAMFHVAIYVCLPGRVSKAGQSCDRFFWPMRKKLGQLSPHWPEKTGRVLDL